MRLTVTHRLNAHFVNADAPAAETFEHEGVRVTVAFHRAPDASFATITCSGLVEGSQQSSGASDQAGGPTQTVQSSPIIDGRFLLPPGSAGIAESEIFVPYARAEAVLQQVGALIRWRFNLSGKDSVFKDEAVTVETEDGQVVELQPLGQFAFGDDQADIAQGELAELTAMVTSDIREPLAHQLLREAWNLRHTNPRSSVVIGVAAAEVGMKQLVAMLVPHARWLVEELPSPPLVPMMRHYLAELPIRADVEPNRRCPKHLRAALQGAVEARNVAVHRGSAPTIALRDMLASVRELLYLFDFYGGHSWAARQLSDATVASLGIEVPARCS